MSDWCRLASRCWNRFQTYNIQYIHYNNSQVGIIWFLGSGSHSEILHFFWCWIVLATAKASTNLLSFNWSDFFIFSLRVSKLSSGLESSTRGINSDNSGSSSCPPDVSGLRVRRKQGLFYSNRDIISTRMMLFSSSCWLTSCRTRLRHWDTWFRWAWTSFLFSMAKANFVCPWSLIFFSSSLSFNDSKFYVMNERS